MPGAGVKDQILGEKRRPQPRHRSGHYKGFRSLCRATSTSLLSLLRPYPVGRVSLGPCALCKCRVTLSQATEQPRLPAPTRPHSRPSDIRSLRTEAQCGWQRCPPWGCPICPAHPHLHRVCQVRGLPTRTAGAQPRRERGSSYRTLVVGGIGGHSRYTIQGQILIVPACCGFVLARPQPALVAPSFSTGCPRPSSYLTVTTNPPDCACAVSLSSTATETRQSASPATRSTAQVSLPCRRQTSLGFSFCANDLELRANAAGVLEKAVSHLRRSSEATYRPRCFCRALATATATSLRVFGCGRRTSLLGDGCKPFSAVLWFPYDASLYLCAVAHAQNPSSLMDPVAAFSTTGARWGPTMCMAPYTQLSAVGIWRRRGRRSGWGCGCGGDGYANHQPEWKAA